MNGGPARSPCGALPVLVTGLRQVLRHVLSQVFRARAFLDQVFLEQAKIFLYFTGARADSRDMETKSGTEILHSFHNADTNMTSYVTAGKFGFHVSVRDLDSGEYLPIVTGYQTLERAVVEAQKIVG